MKNLHFESTTTLKFDAQVTNHQFLLRCIPPNFAGQNIVYAELKIFPSTQYSLSCDTFGNQQQTGCVDFAHAEFSYSISGIATISEYLRKQEPLHPIFKFPSTKTKPSVDMQNFLQGLSLDGSALEKSIKLADAIHKQMEYMPYTTTTKTTAAEAFSHGKGVCQDYSHIFIALARLAGIPARYANGLQLGEGQSHAWAEVYANGMWVGIDPTQNRLVGEDYIRFCIGRDFADSALERGTFVGRAAQTQTTFAQVFEG